VVYDLDLFCNGKLSFRWFKDWFRTPKGPGSSDGTEPAIKEQEKEGEATF
jgi:hypothetical protein